MLFAKFYHGELCGDLVTPPAQSSNPVIDLLEEK